MRIVHPIKTFPRDLLGHLLSLSLLLLLHATNAFAQNSTGGWTAPGLAPGAPNAANSLSNFEDINLYSGHLNATFPLATIGGRGDIGFTPVLNISAFPWSIESVGGPFFPEGSDPVYEFIHTPSQNWWGLTPGYGPGVMNIRKSGKNPQTVSNDDDPPCNAWFYGSHLTRLTFTTGDGTELEFVDQESNGSACPNLDRGRIWTTRDGGVSATFISDDPITDLQDLCESNLPYGATGYLYMKNGVTYRIVNGYVQWMRDRNGNQITFEYGVGGLTKAKDSLNREITFAYAVNDGAPFGLCDRITFKGFNGATRTIHISYAPLSSILRSGYTLQTAHNLFPELLGGSNQFYNPNLISALWLPDDGQNHRSYQFRYNQYAELAQVELPTGGGYQYDYGRGSASGPADGLIGNYSSCCFSSPIPERLGVYRRVQQRRAYASISSNTLETKTTFSTPTISGDPLQGFVQTITVSSLDNLDHLISSSKHYFHFNTPDSILYDELENLTSSPRPWDDGKEFKTESLNSSGTVLKRVEFAWVPAPLPGGPHITDITTTLVDTNQVSKEHLEYDIYNNVLVEENYDFGTNNPGPLLRRSTTSYVTTNAVNNIVYDNPYPLDLEIPLVHLRSLPKQTSISFGSTELARASFEYDKYSGDSNHAALKNWTDITSVAMSGWDTGFLSKTARGNSTATTHYFLVNNTVQGSISNYTQYDHAGNIVKTIDARGGVTSTEFIDRFGIPDGDTRANTRPPELMPSGAPMLNSYAFPTKVTNALGHVAYTQYDFYLDKPVDSEDANGLVTSAFYSDPLDRPTQLIKGSNLAVSLKSQKTVVYDDPGHLITETSDRDSFNDNVFKVQKVYDGLGRTIETRAFETANQYVATQHVPFVVLQDPETNIWISAQQSSNPFRPTLGENPTWTTTYADALGRNIKIRTADNATVKTVYSGNSITATDQAGKSRKSISDALGRLVKVYEDPNSATPPLTVYTYDALDNLLTVVQDTQTRTFEYDSLKRLTLATTPESGTFTYKYDNNDNVLVSTDARGASIHMSYDALDRVTRRWYNGGSAVTDETQNVPVLPSGVGATDEVKFYYDADVIPSLTPGVPTFTRGPSTGRLVALTYGTGSSSGDYYSYNIRGHRTEKIQQTGGVNYRTSAAYNLAGAVISQIYPSDHSVTYNYDMAGRIADNGQAAAFTGTLGDGANRTYAQGLLYEPSGALKQEKFGTTTAAIYHKRAYNSRLQLTDIRVSTIAGDDSWNRGKIHNEYSTQCGATCDNNDNLRKQEIWVPTNNDGSTYNWWYQQYDYDALNRIEAVREYNSSNTLLWQQGYTIDRFGNRRVTSGIGSSLTFEVETATNRLVSPGDQSFPGADNAQRRMRYDAAGNLKIDTYSGYGSPSSASYNAENRMVSAQSSSGQSSSYIYDGMGRRVRRVVAGLETYQIYGLSGELLAEYPSGGATGSPLKEYGYRSGELLVATENGFGALPPSGLMATPPSSGSSITLNWSSASGASNYRVERKPAGGNFTLVGTTSSLSLIDSGAVAGNAYLYRVCAANAAGQCTSSFSNNALGASITFTDPSIVTLVEDPTGTNLTPVRAIHINQLRTAVTAVRSLAGLPPVTGQDVASGNSIYVQDIRNLRTQLDDALQALGIPPTPYTDPTLIGFLEDQLNATTIRAVHIRQLRDRVRSGIGGSSGGGGFTTFQIYWLIPDHLGTPRILVDQSGNLTNVKRHDYLPFGEELFSGNGGRLTGDGYGCVPGQPGCTSDNVRQQFTSKERDVETGIDYFDHRYYGSLSGRFLSPDPLLASAKFTEPQSWNRYAYTLNNPLQFTDPQGLRWYKPNNSGPTGWIPVWFDEPPDNPYDHPGYTLLPDGYVYQSDEEYGYVVLDGYTGEAHKYFETEEEAKAFGAGLSLYHQMNNPGDKACGCSQLEATLEMEMYISGVGGLARLVAKGVGKVVVEEGAEEVVEIAAVQAGTQAAKKIPQVLINRAVGQAAEKAVAKELVENGYTILGSQVAARTSKGLRFIDHLVQDPVTKRIFAVEVKAGGGERTALQVLKDRAMAMEGATLVGKQAAAAGLAGQRLTLRTIVKQVP